MTNSLNLYFYRLLTSYGKIRYGLTKALVDNEQSVKTRIELRTEGTVLNLQRLPGWLFFVYELPGRLFRSRAKFEDLAGFLRDFGVMLTAGVPALDALKTLAEEDAGTPGVASIAKQISEDLDAGMRIPQSFRRHPDIFPEAVQNLSELGDNSGEIAKMMVESAAHVERLIDIKRDISTALIYPFFVMTTILGVGLFWLYYVVPNMAQLFKQMQAKLPPITQWLISISDVLVNYLLLTVILFVVAIGLVIFFYRKSGAFKFMLHKLAHRIPIIKNIAVASGMAFITEYLALLIKAGMDFLSSLEVLSRATTNQYYRDRLIKVRDGVARGEGIAAAMRRIGGFPPMAVRMIAVGEEAGSLDKQLDQLSKEYKKRLDVLVRSLAEVIKPLLILIAGGMFIFLVVALLLPIYDLVRQSVGSSLGR
jgi:type II secretory pathway component PulF